MGRIGADFDRGKNPTPTPSTPVDDRRSPEQGFNLGVDDQRSPEQGFNLFSHHAP